MSFATPDPRSRAVAAAGAVVLQALIAYALLTGLSVRVVAALAPELRVFDVAPPPPPPPPPRIVPTRAKRLAGASAPPHRRANPTPVVAPPPAIVLPPPPPLIVTAPVAALGADSAAGASDRDGPGTGAGGQGSGLGSGNGGDGTGGGAMTHARQIAGDIDGRRDYPREARAAGLEGNLTTRYVIDRRGRIAACAIVESSGYQVLDAQTCRLAIARFRFAPARDASGRPVDDVIFEDHGWKMHAEPGQPD